jgi:hypothetical protein
LNDIHGYTDEVGRVKGRWYTYSKGSPLLHNPAIITEEGKGTIRRWQDTRSRRKGKPSHKTPPETIMNPMDANLNVNATVPQRTPDKKWYMVICMGIKEVVQAN